VAEALEAEPTLVMNLEMITVMGGAVAVPGNIGKTSAIENNVAEWNMYVDPYAAAVVLGSGAPVTLVPLDATNHVPLTMDFYKRLEDDRSNAVAEFVYLVLKAQKESILSGQYYFWDPLAATIATEDELGTYQQMSLVVIEGNGKESGQTLESVNGSIIQVTVSADRQQFETLFLDTINGRLP
jgi:inosine-uridine nucleoside N-ribohydrolase